MVFRFIYLLCLLSAGCWKPTQQALPVLGDTIRLPISIGEARQRYQLNHRVGNRSMLYRLDTTACKAISARYWSNSERDSSELYVWGMNLTISTDHMTLPQVLAHLEQSLKVRFTPDTIAFVPLYKAQLDNVKLAVVRKPETVIPDSAGVCFNQRREEPINTIIMYFCSDLSDSEFENYVASSGDDIWGD